MALEPVVIVSFYFPPHGGAGTQRFAKFAKFLPDFGYKPIVVCSGTETLLASAPTQDPTLLEEIGDQTRVVRVPRPVRTRWATRADRVRLRIDEDDWVTRAVTPTIEAIRASGATALVTTVSPYAVSLLGEVVRQSCRVPWLLDLRDPWALDGWRIHPTWPHARLDRARMRRALSAADLIVSSTPAARPVYARMGNKRQSDVWTIPNGFDASDFDDATPERPEPDRFRIVHVGTLHDPLAEHTRSWRRFIRTAGRRINPLGRTGYYLYLALERVKRLRPQLFERVRLDLYGQVHPNHGGLARDLGIQTAVCEKGYVHHKKAVSALLGADAIFVPLHGLPPGEEALIVPGKLYEALASERFVLAAVPKGDAARLVEISRGGAVCKPDDVEDLTRILIHLLEAWRSGSPFPGATRERLAAFSRRSLAARLARAIDCATGKSSPRDADHDPWVETGKHETSEPISLGTAS